MIAIVGTDLREKLEPCACERRLVVIVDVRTRQDAPWPAGARNLRAIGPGRWAMDYDRVETVAHVTMEQLAELSARLDEVLTVVCEPGGTPTVDVWRE